MRSGIDLIVLLGSVVTSRHLCLVDPISAGYAKVLPCIQSTASFPILVYSSGDDNEFHRWRFIEEEKFDVTCNRLSSWIPKLIPPWPPPKIVPQQRRSEILIESTSISVISMVNHWLSSLQDWRPLESGLMNSLSIHSKKLYLRSSPSNQMAQYCNLQIQLSLSHSNLVNI
ncbi:hypothetical protein NE237_002155 [Protea cynaroides]|uniref:Uncharacterized protein n=1 Tax=Protea cynaroides TaxID=273540 RepID=A0A9Q0KVJ7_9MAGN|nr:hypothetical protein NE237_002155 [Protea cynaroides]